ncbi:MULTISPECIES: histidinol dehydrogenase [Anaerolinea]|uniref:histidinol dehydrogenase n=1 Tax=Anaerolinea TaxID=233189 RepID=UPI002611C10B|nr:histidinol dehydrogenase [Anaerolinea thermophila]
MLRKLNVAEARETLLKRASLDEVEVSPVVLERTAGLLGEPLSPEQAVTRILKDVRQRGDTALREWMQKLDGVTLNTFRVPKEDIQSALQTLSDAQLNALRLAAERIRRFHQAQPLTSWLTQSLGGTLGQLVRPIRRVGVYVPAGSAPLPSSVLMSVIPAQVAGVPEIVVVAPPVRQTGKVDPVILAACALCGVDEVYALGGAQAIAALAYGTESIPPVDKIFGPGNLFVTLAKKQVFGVVGIDGLAGPTETMVIADDSANPEWVAADLLAQAEHDPLASAILLTPSESLIAQVQEAVTRQLRERQRATIIQQSLEFRSGAVLTIDLEEAVRIANEFAPEHLCLSVRDPWALVPKINAAGGIFVGEHSFEVLGDYVAGPSHVMPTGRTARFASPLNVWDFVHLIHLVALDEATTQEIAPAASVIAEREGLDAHAFSARCRC